MSTKILQILTLVNGKGVYGGPVRVAMELADEFSRRNIENRIVAGQLRNDDFLSEDSRFVGFTVRPVLRNLPFSSLFGLRFLDVARAEIKKAEIIHVHFARDLIPLISTMIALLKGKIIILHTHGMLRKDSRLAIRLIDRFITIPLLNRSHAVIVLQNTEKRELDSLGVIPSKLRIIPNGIKLREKYLQEVQKENKQEEKKIVFLSRLSKVKNVLKFAELAKLCWERNLRLKFLVYGPDQGELDGLNDFIKINELHQTISYLGSINPKDVDKILSRMDLLILPSSYDPFPMVILEALNAGCGVLVTPDCGIAEYLKAIDDSLVSRDNTTDGLFVALQHILSDSNKTRLNYQNLAKYFDISKAADEFLEVYNEKR